MGLLKPFPKEPVFTVEELLRFANIADNAGQIFLGVMVLTPLATGLDKTSQPMLFSGTGGTSLAWFISWLLTKKAVKK